MEEKNSIKISISTFFLILAVIVIIVMAYFLVKVYNEKTEETGKTEKLQSQVTDLQGKIDNISKTISSNAKNESTKESTKESTTENTSSKNNNQIIIEGQFAPESGDVFYEFDKNGNVTETGNVQEEKGTYRTIGENEAEITLTTETTVNEETGKKTTKKINRTEKLKVIDENTLSIGDFKLIRWVDGKFVK